MIKNSLGSIDMLLLGLTDYKKSSNKTSLKLAINYLRSNSYFTLDSMHFRKLMGIPMGSDLLLFMAKLFLYYYEMKWIIQTKNKTCKRLVYFQILLRLKIIYAPSVMMVLKIIKIIFILICWTQRRYIRIFVNPLFWISQLKFIIENL